MSGRKFFLLIAFGFMITASSGCASYSEKLSVKTIDSDSIQAYMDDPSGSKISLERGYLVSIYANKKINMFSKEVSSVSIVVNDMDSIRIRGKVIHAYSDTAFGLEELNSKIVEVNLEDIDKITFSTELNKPNSNTQTKHPAAVARTLYSAILLLLVLGAVF